MNVHNGSYHADNWHETNLGVQTQQIIHHYSPGMHHLCYHSSNQSVPCRMTEHDSTAFWRKWYPSPGASWDSVVTVWPHCLPCIFMFAYEKNISQTSKLSGLMQVSEVNLLNIKALTVLLSAMEGEENDCDGHRQHARIQNIQFTHLQSPKPCWCLHPWLSAHQSLVSPQAPLGPLTYVAAI